jgi:hypothetical protein
MLLSIQREQAIECSGRARKMAMGVTTMYEASSRRQGF